MQTAEQLETASAVEPRTGDYLQFGCGLCAPQGWRNFDAGPSFWLQRKVPFLKRALVRLGYPGYPRNIEIGDVVRGLPVPPGSAKVVYCSHVLEHLALDELRVAIRNVYSYLCPGGVFRMVLPDLEQLARSYLDNPNTDANSTFMKDGCLGEKVRRRGVRGLAWRIFGRSKHLWMWDYKGLSQELANAGFVGIRRAHFGDSQDPHFRDVEDPDRWQNHLGIECSKP
jgi:predicted SAM-dependent methyltransferase